MHIHGCACCGEAFVNLFRVNRHVRELASSGPRSGVVGSGRLARPGTLNRRDFVLGSAATAGLAGTLARVAAAEGGATTVFTGGTIVTVDAGFSEAEAMAIRGNRILAVGSREDVRAAAGADAQVVDLVGRTVLPGFVDPHTHVVTGSVVDAVMEYVGMARFATTAEVLDRLRERAAAAAPGDWIVARNYDPVIQEGPEALTFKELDAVSVDHPIFVLNASGHLAYANSKAFAAAGVPDDVPNPPGAEFVRDGEGKLTGVMKNNVAYVQVLEAYPALTESDPVDALIGLGRKFNALGLTTLSDLATGALTDGPEDLAVMSQAAQSGRLTARIRAYPYYTHDQAWDDAGIVPGMGDHLIRLAGYKLVADGSNQGFTGLQREPYLGTDNHGLAYLEPEKLNNLALKRARQGWQLAIHGNGDKAIDNVLDAFEAVHEAGIDLAARRPRIEHCSILHDGQIARMRKLGVSASFLIGHVYYWGVAMRDQVFGEAKARLLDRAKSVEAEGVGYTLHSDFMVTDPDPLHMIEMAVTRRTWKEPNYVLAPEERITVESAIKAVTWAAAWQLGSEHEVGSLEAGKFADFVILEDDPRDVPVDAIKDVTVLETWMDGRQVYAA